MGRAGFKVWHCLIAGLVHGFLKPLFKKKSILMDHKCIMSFTFLTRESSTLSGLLQQKNVPSFFINTKVISVFSIRMIPIEKNNITPITAKSLHVCHTGEGTQAEAKKKKKKTMQTST